MRSSPNGLKNATVKKKTSTNGTSTTNNDQTSQMSKTSLSSLSSTTTQKNQDKLCQLKQKLQMERQNMRKSGRRFKVNSSQIQIQTQQQQQIKPSTTKTVFKTGKTSTGVGVSSTTASNLYDFNSIKTQVQNKTNRLFAKKQTNTKKDPIIPVYTTQQILNSTTGLVGSRKSTQKQQKKKQPQMPLKRQTVNLMQLSVVIQNSPSKHNISTSKQRLSTKQGQMKFFDPAKVKKLLQNSKNSQIMANSKVFESAIKQQKKRNNQIEEFLSKVGLESFSQSFINLGFDQVQTLIEVQVDDLNQMMMRANQQDRLMKFIKLYKQVNSIQDQPEKPLIDRPAAIKSRLGHRSKSAAMITQPSESKSTAQSSRMRSTTQNLSMSQSTLVSKSSIFYSIGGSEWSLESQIRKACSGCFKVSSDVTRRGDCYYCCNCDPGQIGQLQISLDESMVRNYH